MIRRPNRDHKQSKNNNSNSWKQNLQRHPGGSNMGNERKLYNHHYNIQHASMQPNKDGNEKHKQNNRKRNRQDTKNYTKGTTLHKD